MPASTLAWVAEGKQISPKNLYTEYGKIENQLNSFYETDITLTGKPEKMYVEKYSNLLMNANTKIPQYQQT